MKFVDRVAELSRLDRLMKREDSALAVIWGRRRIGKTRLLLEWAARHGGLYWVADESSAHVQRRYFASAVEARLPGFGQVEYPDWASLWARLCREAKQARWRGPLIIDELPYLLGASPELPSLLQRIVDHEAKTFGLVLALSGSSQRMMQGLTLDQSNPLYGRAAEAMKIEPLPAGYLGQALAIQEPRDIIASFAAWGGVPRYWELAKPFESLLDAVDALVLDPMGPLHDEPARLLLEENPPAVALRPLLDVIGGGAHRGSEIAGRLGQPATSLARPLARLQELELVTREIPFGEPERSGKRALYKLGDPFLRLWFSVVASRRAVFLQASKRARLRLFQERASSLIGIAWEDLCRQALPPLAEEWADGGFGPAKRFWHRQGPEWDAVAESHDGQALLLGEAKWLERNPTASEVEALVARLMAKGTPSQTSTYASLHHVVFVPHRPKGVSKTKGRVHVIEARDVLAALR